MIRKQFSDSPKSYINTNKIVSAQKTQIFYKTRKLISRSLYKIKHQPKLFIVLAALISLSLGLFLSQNSDAINGSDLTNNTVVAQPNIPSNLNTNTNSASGVSNEGSSDTSTGTTTNNSSVNVTVNGQAVNNIPQSGSYSKTINTPNGQTNISVNSSHTSNGNDSQAVNNSTTVLNVNSSSSSESNND